MKIVPVDPIWILADLPQEASNALAIGSKATITSNAFPGTELPATVALVYPEMDHDTRRVRVRLSLRNGKGLLRPNMFVTVGLRVGDDRPVLQVPSESVIRAADGQRVIVAMGNGRFVPRQVKIAAEWSDTVEILDGLAEGEEVVTNALFMIDSEASLKASLDRMKGGTMTPHEEHSRPDGT
jgi:Cu(I)/Ag(I) efflux system membrane fusion protein